MILINHLPSFLQEKQLVSLQQFRNTLIVRNLLLLQALIATPTPGET